MASPSELPRHPGPFVRDKVIPADMSVTGAAKRLGIGRPALSNFLNGKAALSHEMAVRLEKAFGADRKRLLDMQAAYEQHVQSGDQKAVTVRAFVPSFLTIQARQIEAWARAQLDARSHLPVLLRKLIHSTSSGLLQVDFPGYDNAQRKGNDGIVEAESATPWTPKGRSYWEFGTDQDPPGKAKKDFVARLKSIDPAQRAVSTFVFVTPYNWSGKNNWENERNEAGEWAAVRALDASDLEQWLEQSVPAQVWLAEQLALPVDGYETLEQAWCRWANAGQPHLDPEIFVPSVAAYRNKFKAWLERSSERPFVVAADSKDEALAFLACLFNEPSLCRHKDLASVFTGSGTLRKLLASSISFIPIVHSEDVERELSDAHRRLHCIVYRPRNAVDTEPDVSLGLLNYEAFSKALTTMGIEEGDIDRLARESGRSPTILRRRLSENAAIRTPIWAGDDETAKCLAPAVLIGTWHAESDADREIASRLADQKYEAIEGDVARLLRFDDSPVWSAGSYRGVVSKIDALYAIQRMVTPEALKRFFVAAEYVLSETDPALQLPESDRWAAAMYGKTRTHSAALRKGICETLVILSVHGNTLFQSRSGIDVEERVALLIRKLLTPLTSEKLLSHDHDLPHYAEAAPDEFLRIIENDLRNLPHGDSLVLGLLKPVDRDSIWASPSRTGLLWALECLSWSPRNLPRVLAILAQLSRSKIDDNWVNKPEATLKAIFRSWMPQTATPLEQRIRALEGLSRRYPDIGWKICIEQVNPESPTGDYSYKPRWRSDASGAGQVIKPSERRKFTRKSLDMLIKWPSHDERTLGDLVECIQQNLPEEDQGKIWDLIEKWSAKAGEAAKAALRERIRRFALSERSRHRKLEKTTRDRAREVYDSLLPRDPVIRHGWLFADQWVQESINEIQDTAYDYQRREDRIDKLRRQSMAEIWGERRFDGIWELFSASNDPGLVGRYAALNVNDVNERAEFVRRCLLPSEDLRTKAEWCLRGFLATIEEDACIGLLRSIAKTLPDEEIGRIFAFAPFRGSTWKLADSFDDSIRTRYWKEAVPFRGPFATSELTTVIDHLLEVRRPRAAFRAVQMDVENIETSRLKQLLRDVATVGSEPEGHYRIDSYYISKALTALDGRPGVTADEMAQLEFLFIKALDDSEHGIPNLESQIAQTPMVFVQALAFAFKRSDDGEDPEEWTIDNPDRRENIASAAYRLLDQIRKIPGADDGGRINGATLVSWLGEVRRLCHEYGRADIGDHCLGQLLAKSPGGENGIWPCETVCEAMETIASQELGRGFHIGVLNSRGAYYQGEGGAQERELAAKYRTWAEHLNFDYPYVGSLLEWVATSYDKEASWQDTEAEISNRTQLH